MPSYRNPEVSTIDRVYYWMLKITLSGDAEESKEYIGKPFRR